MRRSTRNWRPCGRCWREKTAPPSRRLSPAPVRCGRSGGMNVFVLNSGSSTLKFQLIATDLDRIKQNADERLCRGQVERIGGEAIITVQARNGSRQKFTASLHDISAALEYLVRW